MSDIETLIVSRLMKSEEYARKALPNVRSEYFRSGSPERVGFELVREYSEKYGKLPTPEAIIVELQSRRDLSEELFRETGEFLEKCLADTEPSDTSVQWLLDQTEQYCQDRAIHIALSKSLEILRDEGERGLSRSSIPKLLQDALAVTFDPHIGHDYLEDASDRYDLMHQPHRKLAFDVDSFNKVTRGGFNPKTMNVLMATAGAGKSLLMCHFAANNLVQGKNVLYITLELSAEWVGTRVDANLMGVDLDLIESLPRDVFEKKIRAIREKTTGKLIIKEYSSAGASHFRYLLSELKTKKGFVPDVVYVDYLNICVPTGRKGDMNSYEKVKLIGEELRAIAVDFDVPLVTATQSNRSAYGSSSVGMEAVSDSLGTVMTADWLAALVQTSELKQMNQYKVVQLKSRYQDIGKKPYWFIGVRPGQMRIYDLDRTSHQAEEDEEWRDDPVVSQVLSFTGFK